MEEQRQRQEDEARRATVVSAAEAGVPSPTGDGERKAGQLRPSFTPTPVLLVDFKTGF